MNKKRRQYKKRLVPKVTRSVRARNGRVTERTYTRDSYRDDLAETERGYRCQHTDTGGIDTHREETESVASLGTQAVTVEVRCAKARRKLNWFANRYEKYTVLNDGEPIQKLGNREFFSIGIRSLDDSTVDWFKRQEWIASVQGTVRAVPGKGMEYRRGLDQLRANKRERQVHDTLARNVGNWGG